jgi:hypothetical protein
MNRAGRIDDVISGFLIPSAALVEWIPVILQSNVDGDNHQILNAVANRRASSRLP